MKQLIFLLLFAVSALIAPKASAQFTMGKDTTVILNAKTMNLTVKANQVFDVATFQINVIRNSGTVGGSCILQGSLDGAQWKTLNDTLTLTNVATQVGFWNVVHPYYLFYRIRCTGTGTMNATPTGYFLPRKL